MSRNMKVFFWVTKDTMCEKLSRSWNIWWTIRSCLNGVKFLTWGSLPQSRHRHHRRPCKRYVAKRRIMKWKTSSPPEVDVLGKRARYIGHRTYISQIAQIGLRDAESGVRLGGPRTDAFRGKQARTTALLTCIYIPARTLAEWQSPLKKEKKPPEETKRPFAGFHFSWLGPCGWRCDDATRQIEFYHIAGTHSRFLEVFYNKPLPSFKS